MLHFAEMTNKFQIAKRSKHTEYKNKRKQQQKYEQQKKSVLRQFGEKMWDNDDNTERTIITGINTKRIKSTVEFIERKNDISRNRCSAPFRTLCRNENLFIYQIISNKYVFVCVGICSVIQCGCVFFQHLSSWMKYHKNSGKVKPIVD